MSTPTPTTSPSAMRSRILTHMNADHHLSLILYSRYYSKLPLSAAKKSHLSDITLTHMTITTSFGQCMVPFDPPLASFAEVRERVVAMHQTALKGLDVEDIIVDEYRLPNRMWMWIVMLLVAATIFTFPFRSQLHPDSGSVISLFWSVGGLAKWNAVLVWKLSPVLWPLTVAIHTVEAVWMATGRLRRYQVEMGGVVWWEWVGSCFFEGMGAYMRFDEMVGELRVVKEGRKVSLKGGS